MQIRINSDNHVKMNDQLSAFVEDQVQKSLGRFAPRLTTVEAHLGDENSVKSGAQDQRCQIEARPKGLDPVSATHFAATLEDAVRGASQKLQRQLDTIFGRLADKS